MKEHIKCGFRWKTGNGERRKTWQQISEARAVVFPDAVEHHGPGGHVHSHRKRLGGKQNLGDEGETWESLF